MGKIFGSGEPLKLYIPSSMRNLEWLRGKLEGMVTTVKINFLNLMGNPEQFSKSARYENCATTG